MYAQRMCWTNVNKLLRLREKYASTNKNMRQQQQRRSRLPGKCKYDFNMLWLSGENIINFGFYSVYIKIQNISMKTEYNKIQN